MRVASRIFLAFFLIVGLSFYWFSRSIFNEFKPVVRQSSEETMIDAANLLAEFASKDLADQLIATQDFKAPLSLEQKIYIHQQTQTYAQTVANYHRRKFNGNVWGITKTRPALELYITNQNGIVIFHTDPNEIGKDYIEWRDVFLTLKGQYGARTTRIDPKDESSSWMFVAAPIFLHKTDNSVSHELIGVLTLSKDNRTVEPFVDLAQEKLSKTGLIAMSAAILLGLLLSAWLTLSIRRLTQYANDIRDGKRIPVPKITEKELAQLAAAIHEMREEIDGKQYVEQYIHTLTHEMKSPIAAIHGASELLQEPAMHEPGQELMRDKFLNNIYLESDRLRQLTDRILQLASLEKQQGLQNIQQIHLTNLINTVIASKVALCTSRNITLTFQQTLGESTDVVSGDPLLLEQALSNLIDNAMDFSPNQSTILIHLSATTPSGFVITVADEGEGIPDYALKRIFERFYSLPRPQSGKNAGRKSTGLGLSFVYEIMGLHNGSIHIDNRLNDQGQIIGAIATLTFR